MNKYENISISDALNEALNESIDEWEEDYDQVGDFIYKEWPNGFNAQIYFPDGNYNTFYVNLCRNYDDYLQDNSKEFDSLDKAKEYAETIYHELYDDLGNELDESLTEALKITRSQVYHTKFGEFIIETKEGKARRRDYMTGKIAWKQVRYINGYFVDQPDFAKFYVEIDGPDKYVTCSEGNNSYDFTDILGTDDFGDAVEMVDSEVVKCFQHYYKDDSIR